MKFFYFLNQKPLITMGNQATLDYNSLFPAETFHFGYADDKGDRLNGHCSTLHVAWPLTGTEPGQQEIADMIACARQNERKLIGQELHDNVNQLLFTVKLFMQMLQPGTERDKDIQQKSIDYLMMAIDEIRKISCEMVTDCNGDIELAESIRSIISDIHFSTSIRIGFSYNSDIELLSIDKKTNLLRIVQEQLKNVISYSKASKVTIDLQVKHDNVVLTVSDNGVGFDARQECRGIGVTNIHDRAHSCNGRAELQTAKDQGCEWVVTIPVA
jgi:signal transduction histidine kinase